MKEEEIIKRYISRSNQNWGGATPEWVEKEFRQALQSYKDWLWNWCEENKCREEGVEEEAFDEALSEIQKIIKPK